MSEPEFYTAQNSPFYNPHCVSDTPVYVSYSDLSKNFEPKLTIKPGSLVADTKSFKVGTCVKVGRIRRKHGIYVTISGINKNKNKNVRLTDCVAVPAIKQYMRSKKTKKWFQMSAPTDKMAELHVVYKGPAPVPAPAPALYQYAHRLAYFACLCTCSVCSRSCTGARSCFCPRHGACGTSSR